MSTENDKTQTVTGDNLPPVDQVDLEFIFISYTNKYLISVLKDRVSNKDYGFSLGGLIMLLESVRSLTNIEQEPERRLDATDPDGEKPEAMIQVRVYNVANAGLSDKSGVSWRCMTNAESQNTTDQVVEQMIGTIQAHMAEDPHINFNTFLSVDNIYLAKITWNTEN